MSTNDVIGYVAAGLVFAAFGMRTLIPLRVIAIASNIMFLTYGFRLGLIPVLALHSALLPCNLWRLRELLGERAGSWAARRRDIQPDRPSPMMTRMSDDRTSPLRHC